MGAILGFLKRLYEHKEKIILGALVIAFIGVGYVQWKEREGGDGSEENGGEPDIPRVPDGAELPPVPDYAIPNLGNRLSMEKQLTITDDEIFKKPVLDKKTSGDDQPAAWPKIEIRSIFDATKSGTFIAIIEVNGKRLFMKEGEVFLEYYLVRRIDGVRNCMTIVKRESRSDEEAREICKDN